MSPVQIVNQIFLFVLLCFATVLVVIALQHKGKPWQRGMPGVGGAIFYLGYALNLISNKLSSDARYDITLLYLGVIIMSIPRMVTLIGDIWEYRPTILRRSHSRHAHSGD